MLQFVREIPIRILIQKASSERRGFLFYLAAGFSKEVNPLSGMTVNLVLVDQWLKELKEAVESAPFISEHDNLNASFAEIMAVTRLNLVEKAEQEGASLISLEFREERSWSFSWDHEMPVEELSMKYNHFMEALPLIPSESDLLKIEFKWRRQQNCDADFHHEDFKILKPLAPRDHGHLHSLLKEKLNTKLASGSTLEAIQVHHLGGKFSVEV